MGAFVRDVRRAVRGFLRRPGFTAVAILTLALGIGATTALYSVIRGVLLAPLPYPESGRLVWLTGSWSHGSGEGTSPPDFHDYRDRSRTLDLAAATPFAPPMNLTGFDRPEQLDGRQGSAGLFRVLGIRPVLGREFTREEEVPGGPKVAILSHELWARRFGADSAVLGKPTMLNGVPYTVVGVLPVEAAELFGKTDVWSPIQLNFPTLRHVRLIQMVGRLKAGVGINAAQDEMSGIASRLGEEYPDSNRDWRIHLTPLAEKVLGPYRLALWVLFGAVVGVLLIACVNVANLILSRALARDSEFAVQAALGASRGHLARMLLTESLVLALAGGVAGCIVAFVGVRLATVLAPPSIPRLAEVKMDGGVLLFALLASLLTGVLFGVPPALRAVRADLSWALKEGGRTSTGAGRFRSALVVGQVALTLVLLVGALLFVRSLWRLGAVDPGFRTERLLVTRMTIPAVKYNDGAKRAAFWRDVIGAVELIPGVRSAGVVTELPMTKQDNPTSFTAVGPRGDSLVINVRSVTPGYLSTMGVPLVRGRQLGPEDRSDGQMAVVINQAMARDFYPDQDPVGREFKFDFAATPTTAQVVGVVGDIRHSSLGDEPARETYFSVEQTPLLTYNLVVHTDGEPLSLASAVRRAVQELDPDQPLSAFQTMESLVSESLAHPRFRSVLLALFAALALLLSMVGLYGVVSFMVAQRTREIGIRMAVGAREGDILRLILGKGLVLSAVGLVLGAVGAVAATRILASMLYGVGTLDWLSYAVAAIVLLSVAFVASYLPARRASRIDPVRALRYE